MGSVNYIVYLRENLSPDEKIKVAGCNLSDVIKQLRLPEGNINAHGKDVVTVTGTSNGVGAALKMALGRWCIVETYVEVHHKITKNLGPIARGG